MIINLLVRIAVRIHRPVHNFVLFATSRTGGVNNQPVVFGDTGGINNQPVTYSDTDGVNRICGLLVPPKFGNILGILFINFMHLSIVYPTNPPWGTGWGWVGT